MKFGDEHIGYLGPSQWRYRLPFYGTQVNSTTVAMNEATQTVMDQEIAYAVAAGLNYWAFNHYLNEGRASLNLYLSSSLKSQIKYALQLAGMHPTERADAVALMSVAPAKDTYLTVLSGRPVVFLQSWTFPSLGYTKAGQVDPFRAEILAATGKNPYFVCQHFTASQTAADVTTYGCDAIGTYAYSGGGPGPLVEHSWATFTAETRAAWNAYAATGRPTVITVRTGWDRRPITGSNAGRWVTYATPTEIAGQLQAALNWVETHQAAAAVPNLIQIYALE